MRNPVLVIAGYDTSGGAGIMADMRALSAIGVTGYYVITCLTIQSPDGVKTIIPFNLDQFQEQIDSILSRIKVKYVKIGMLYSRDILKSVSDVLEDRDIVISVVDPVFIASDGTKLYEKGYIDLYREKIIPNSYLVTPNFQEARIISNNNGKIDDVARTIYNMGAKNILIKGGHLDGEYSIDVLFDGKKFHRFSLPRIKRKRWHGTGCTFSSLITANIAKGRSLRDSIDLSKRILWSMMMNSRKIKNFKTMILGNPKPIDIPPKDLNGERFQVWRSLNISVKKIAHILPEEFIPEVGINFGYATKDARSRRDVCSLKRRMWRDKHLYSLDFGASKHIASVILAVMNFDRTIRSAMNIRYLPDTVRRFREAGFKVSSFKRENEPNDVSTMDWGTRRSIERLSEIPDIIYDTGFYGKEAMIRVIGKNPRDVVEKIKSIL